VTTLPRSVGDVLDAHTEVEYVDRMYRNVYQPRLRHVNGVGCLLRGDRGVAFSSSAPMDPISKGFVASIHRFCQPETGPTPSMGRPCPATT
jgi:hypothetical protein